MERPKGQTESKSTCQPPSPQKSIARILKEYNQIKNDPDPDWCAYPLNIDHPFDWHFTIRGPVKSEFEGGLYHGRIILPTNYPFSPPSVFLLTPNGRFEIGKKICLNISDFHPESWHPVWGLRTILIALRVFLPTPSNGALSSLDLPMETRIKFAQASSNWICPICKKTNLQIMTEMCPDPITNSSHMDTPELVIPEGLLYDLTDEIDKDYQKFNPATREDQSDDISKSMLFPEIPRSDEDKKFPHSRRKRSGPEPSSFFRRLISDPLKNLDLILIALDVLLGIFFMILMLLLSHFILDIINLF